MNDKVTPEQIQAKIKELQYYVFPGTTVTTCLLTLENGSKILGKNYGRINPEEQDWELGKRYAYTDAVNQIWELEGYLVREALYQASVK